MRNILRQGKFRLSKEDIKKLSCFFYDESNGLLATAFFNLPLLLKRHCVQVGVTAGQMARYVPDSAIPEGMTRGEYANAVRYGCLYHDIGVYLVYNKRDMYPDAGERFLRGELDNSAISPAAKRMILEIVQYCGERYDGHGYPDQIAGDAIPMHAGICAIADKTDSIVSGRMGRLSTIFEEVKTTIRENNGIMFHPGAVECFTRACGEIFDLYGHWRKRPPLWNNSDIKPMGKTIDQPIG